MFCHFILHYMYLITLVILLVNTSSSVHLWYDLYEFMTIVEGRNVD